MTSNKVLFMPDGSEIEVPTRWAICGLCEGHGLSSAHLGSFTASEFQSACDCDPNFAEDYRSGAYDRRCENCGGSGKVVVVDLDKLTSEHRKQYKEQCEADAEFRAEQDAERRMLGGY